MSTRREHYKQSFEAPQAQVLVVDDNETNLMVAEKLLRDTKVKISAAVSGKECLKKTLRNRYDVIFMDHLMPELDGIECLHAMRAQTGGLNQDTPVIVLKNSSMKVGSIRIGTRDSARRQYITSTLNVMGEIDRDTLFITYAGLTVEELKEIEEQVKSKVNFEHVICQKASSAITTNCGPGSFGLLFMMHDRDRADRI